MSMCRDLRGLGERAQDRPGGGAIGGQVVLAAQEEVIRATFGASVRNGMSAAYREGSSAACISARSLVTTVCGCKPCSWLLAL